jgi:sodium transport system ATP-binding protein
MIKVRGLTKVFAASGRSGPVRAVDGISFEAQGGEVFGLLGLNGAGKTTTLRMLATVLRPTAGTALVAGYDITTAGDQVRQKIGFLSGDTRLYDRLTARELLIYFGQLNGLNGEQSTRKADALIGRFTLAEASGQRIGQLSTGLKQRVNLARALIHAPPVLILDEPTAGLDVLGAREVGRLIGEVRDEGHCVLLSTHVMHVAAKLCDQLAIIHQGKILASGSPSELAAGHDDLEDAFAVRVDRAREVGAAGGPTRGSGDSSN